MSKCKYKSFADLAVKNITEIQAKYHDPYLGTVKTVKVLKCGYIYTYEGKIADEIIDHLISIKPGVTYEQDKHESDTGFFTTEAIAIIMLIMALIIIIALIKEIKDTRERWKK